MKETMQGGKFEALGLGKLISESGLTFESSPVGQACWAWRPRSAPRRLGARGVRMLPNPEPPFSLTPPLPPRPLCIPGDALASSLPALAVPDLVTTREVRATLAPSTCHRWGTCFVGTENQSGSPGPVHWGSWLWDEAPGGTFRASRRGGLFFQAMPSLTPKDLPRQFVRRLRLKLPHLRPFTSRKGRSRSRERHSSRCPVHLTLLGQWKNKHI